MRAFMMFLLTGICVSPAFAQTALRVQPVTVDVVAPAQASSVTLQNRGKTPISLQVQVFEWTQVDGADVYRPTTEVVASPPRAMMEPGVGYTVRLARTGNTAISGEKAYRLWINEQPPAQPPKTEGGQVDVRIRYDIPVFFHQPGAKPALTWRAFRERGNLYVGASNSGTGHARIEQLAVDTARGPWPVTPGLAGYVLAGSSRSWRVPPRNDLPQGRADVDLIAKVDGGEMRKSILIDQR